MLWICCTESIKSLSFSLSINLLLQAFSRQLKQRGLWNLGQFAFDKWTHVIVPSKSPGTPTWRDYIHLVKFIFCGILRLLFFITPQNQKTKGLSFDFIFTWVSKLSVHFLCIIINQHFLWKQFGGFSDKKYFLLFWLVVLFVDDSIL